MEHITQKFSLPQSTTISDEKLDQCLEVLTSLVKDPALIHQLPEEIKLSLYQKCGIISRPTREETKKRRRQQKKQAILEKRHRDRQLSAKAGIQKARQTSLFRAPVKSEQRYDTTFIQKLEIPRACYICDKKYTDQHFFYDALCPACGEYNYEKRFQIADLKGKTALITGGRLKIGYQATLLLLRAGATVIATSRFPVDAALRFSKEIDYSEWKDRLHIYSIDLRHTPSVELFANMIFENYDRLDIIINNAAQTVRRPSGFYSHLLENESKTIDQLPKTAQQLLIRHFGFIKQIKGGEEALENRTEQSLIKWNKEGPGVGIHSSARMSQIPYHYEDTLTCPEVFPQGQLDCDGQQVDLRKTNSWRLRLGEIAISEMLEVQLVNSIAPFVLCNSLIPLMQKDFTGQKHIVNVTAMEGKFYRFKKESRHPHTNMAKAALNMLTHTASKDLLPYGIHINAVDTGWVTDEDPADRVAEKKSIHNFTPPIDIVDGAARVCDPIFSGLLTGQHMTGKFLKDYFPIDW